MDSQSVVEGICDFLEVDFEEEMLRYFQSKEAKKSATLSKSWSKTGEPIQKGNYNKFRTSLHAEEIADVESVCFETMKHFGYKPDYPLQPPKPSLFTQKWLSIKEQQLRLGIEWHSMWEDKNHLLRWKRDFLAGYFAFRRSKLTK